MTEMGDYRPAVDLGEAPAEEEISPADAVERADEDPDEQQNRRDPVWDDDEDHED